MASKHPTTSEESMTRSKEMNDLRQDRLKDKKQVIKSFVDVNTELRAEKDKIVKIENENKRLQQQVKTQASEIKSLTDKFIQLELKNERLQNDLKKLISDEVVIKTHKTEDAPTQSESNEALQQICELKEIVRGQQHYMEALDSEKRACKLIIRGVPENKAVKKAKTDIEKVNVIMKTIECEDEICWHDI